GQFQDHHRRRPGAVRVHPGTAPGKGSGTMKHLLGGLLVLASAAAPWGAANAQAASADLQSCVVAATGVDDRRTLVQWMFSAIALHPDLQDMAHVSDERRDRANGAMGELMV